MPYIKPDEVKAIRNAIKNEFKNYKFSITTIDYSEVNVTILEADIDFNLNECGYEQVNHYWIENNYDNNPIARDFLLRIIEIIETVKPNCIVDDNPDYGSIPNYYMSIHIGKWDKPYKLIKV